MTGRDSEPQSSSHHQKGTKRKLSRYVRKVRRVSTKCRPSSLHTTKHSSKLRKTRFKCALTIPIPRFLAVPGGATAASKPCPVRLVLESSPSLNARIAVKTALAFRLTATQAIIHPMKSSVLTRWTFLVAVAGLSAGSIAVAMDEPVDDAVLVQSDPEPPAPELPKYSQRQVRRFVSQLASDRFADRQLATKKLIAIGTPAVEQLGQAIRTGDLEVQLRAFKCLEAFFGSENFEAVSETWTVLEQFTEDPDRLIAERSRDLLTRYGSVRGKLVVKRIKSMKGIVRTLPRANSVFPEQTMIAVDSKWTGGDHGLQFLKILREKGMPPGLTVYIIDGAPVSLEAVAELELALVDARILVQTRGRATLGISGGTNFRVRRGCEIREVSGRAAADAGIRKEDVIVKFGNDEVEDFYHLVELIREYDVGDQVDVEYLRAGVKKDTKVTLDGWESILIPPKQRPRLGIQFRPPQFRPPPIRRKP